MTEPAERSKGTSYAVPVTHAFYDISFYLSARLVVGRNIHLPGTDYSQTMRPTINKVHGMIVEATVTL